MQEIKLDPEHVILHVSKNNCIPFKMNNVFGKKTCWDTQAKYFCVISGFKHEPSYIMQTIPTVKIKQLAIKTVINCFNIKQKLIANTVLKVSVLDFFSYSVFSRIRIEYGEIRCISPNSVQMRKNRDQKNSEYGHFSRSVRSVRHQNYVGL